jgi:putative hemolysin
MAPGDIAAFIGLLLCSGFFSGTESALTAISDVTVHRLVEEGHRRGRLLEHMLKDKRRVIAALLVGNTIINALIAIFASLVFDTMLQGLALPHWAIAGLAGFLAILVILIFGEILPKAVAVTFPRGVSMLVAWPAYAVVSVLSPVTWVLELMTKALVGLLGGGRTEGESKVSVDELQTMAKMGQQMGVIDSMEMEIVQKASVLNETKVREIMVPRTDIHAIPSTTTLAQLRATFKRDLYSRTPVFLHDLDDILGVLNYKEILRLSPADEAKFNLQDYLHPGLFVPETMSVGVLLNKMRERRSHLAIVIDEYGGTSGLVTFEDIVEVLVGRIEDEYDVTSRLIERRANGVWEVDGRLGIEELQETIGQDLSGDAREGAVTAAGLALKAFGKIPSEGEETTYHSLRFKATRVRDQRVRRLEISKLEGFSAESVRISEHPLSDDTSVMPFPAIKPKADEPH